MVTTTYHDYQIGSRNETAMSFLRFIEGAVYWVVILYFSGAITGLLFNDYENLSSVSGTARLLWYPIYGLVLILALTRLVSVLRISVMSPLIVICVMWCGMSMLWSIDPGVSQRRAIALLITTLAGLALAARYDWNELVQRAAFAFLTLAVISVFVVILNPSAGIHSDVHAGAWRGPWVEKNSLGGNMAKGLVLAICAFAMRPDRYWLWIPAGLLCFALVLLSTSKTALLISVAAIGLFLALRLFRRFPILRIPVIYFMVTGIGIFIACMIAIPEEMLGLIGKDTSFTGRTDIWYYLSVSIKEKWLLGYGYGVYWMDPLGPSYSVRSVLEWGVPTAHNGWIESWLSGGIVLVGLFGLHYFIVFLLAFDRIKRGGAETYWAVLSTLFFLAFSVSESTILQQNDLSWVLFVATSAKLTSFERPYWRDRARIPYFLQGMVSRRASH